MQRQGVLSRRPIINLVERYMVASFRTGKGAPDVEVRQEWQSNTMKLRQLIVEKVPVPGGDDMVILRIKGARRGTPRIVLPQWLLKENYTLVSEMEYLGEPEVQVQRVPELEDNDDADMPPAFPRPVPSRWQKAAGEQMAEYLEHCIEQGE